MIILAAVWRIDNGRGVEAASLYQPMEHFMIGFFKISSPNALNAFLNGWGMAPDTVFRKLNLTFLWRNG